jgi:hypothetical protein
MENDTAVAKHTQLSTTIGGLHLPVVCSAAVAEALLHLRSTPENSPGKIHEDGGL